MVMMMAVIVAVLVPITMIVSVIRVLAADAELRCRQAGAGDALGPDRVRLDREAAERGAERCERDAGIDQRSEDHVAGCA